MSVEDFIKGISDVLAGNNTEITHAEAQKVVNEHFQKMAEEAYAVNKEAGEKFLAENAKKEGVVVLPSGLQYEVLTEGNGKKPSAADRVQCHYEGTLIDGTIFDSSIKRGEPAVFGVNQVIRGWVEALQLMQEGAKWRLYIPYDMAYGEHGAGEMIPPYSALVFDVELIKVL
jgi:FKBP-type peptidyl-prolyl cis-trans isomerase FklB